MKVKFHIYSWRGFNQSFRLAIRGNDFSAATERHGIVPRPDLRSALCRGHKGIKPESSTTREQHASGLYPAVDYLNKFFLFGTLELSPAFMPAEVDNGNYRNCSFGSVCTDGPAFDFAGAGSE
jgi:hypothetical protein